MKKGHQGFLHFDVGENIKEGKQALIEAGVALKKFVKVPAVRGEKNVLRFIQVTKKEFNKAGRRVKKTVKAGAGMVGKRKPRRRRAGRNGVAAARAVSGMRGRRAKKTGARRGRPPGKAAAKKGTARKTAGRKRAARKMTARRRAAA